MKIVYLNGCNYSMEIDGTEFVDLSKEEAKKLLPILQAWVDGKTIQQEVVTNQDRGELSWEDTSESWLDVNYPK